MASNKRYYPAKLSPEAAVSPDCCTCAERKTCPQASEGSFCTRWHSREPEPRGADPNQLWEQGEDVAF